MRRLFLALSLLMLAGLFAGLYAIVASRPQTGSITGVVLDDTTHQPISGAWVSLDLSETSPSTHSRPEEPQIEVTDAAGSTAAPFGWAQGASSDGGDDGVPSIFHRRRHELYAETDENGRYTIQSVPVGRYQVAASADGYDYGQISYSVPVAEDRTATQNMQLTEAESQLYFDYANMAWLPTEDATLGLNGTLRKPDVLLRLEKVDPVAAVAHAPQMVVGGPYEFGETPVAWPGEFTPVREWPLARKDAASRSLTERVHLGHLAEGLYRVTASNPDAVARTFILVTRLALIRKTYGDHVLAYACDLATGAPVAGASLALYQDKGKMLASATTGADGLATLPIRGAEKESKGILVARSGPSVAGVPLEMGGVNEGAGAPDAGSSGDSSVAASAGALRAFIYTERTIYRPGQTVYFKGIFRRFLLGRHGLQIPANEKVALDIRDPQDTLVAHQDVTTDALGSWNGSVALSTEALTGEYTLHAEIGGQKADGAFVVAAYRKPEYKVTAAFAKPRYVRGDTLTATVAASYYFGAPVAGAKLHYDITESDAAPDDHHAQFHGDEGADTPDSGPDFQSGDIRLDDLGRATITMPTQVQKDDSQDSSYTLNVSVEDPSGRSVEQTADTVVGQGEFSLTATLSREFVSPGDPVTATIRAAGPDDKPRAGQPVHILTGIQEWKDDKETIRAAGTQDVVTGADGKAVVTMPTSRTGLVLVRATATDRRGNGIQTEEDLWVSSGDTDLGAQYPDLSVVLDKDKYHPGDTARVLINAEKPGPSALVTIEGATLYRSWIVPLAHKSTAVSIPVTEDYAPGVTVSVCCLLDKQFLTSQQTLAVDSPMRALNVAVQGDAAKYGPGDPAAVTVRTTDKDGHPAPAEVSLGVVDGSLYAIRPESGETIESAFLPDQGDAVDTQYSCPQRFVGDVDKGSSAVKLRRKFPDTALWRPVIMTDASGTATVRFTLPDNLTTWRVTCYGHTADTAVGKGTADLLVSKDLVVRLEAPSFFTAGDHTTLAAVVTNNGTSPLTAQVRLAATSSGAATVKVDGAGTPRTVQVAPGASERVEWPAQAVLVSPNAALSTAPEAAAGTTLTGPLAPVDFTLTATAGGRSDGVEQTIPVKPRAALSDTWQAGSLVGLADETVTLTPGAVPGATTLRIHLSPTVSSALIPALDSLSAYPYPTTDSAASTLVSDVIVAQASAGAQPAIPMDPERRKRLPDEIDRCQRRLYRYQSDDGSWGWCVGNRADLWETAYAAWALGRAAKAGYPGNDKPYQSGLSATASLVESSKGLFAYGDGSLHPVALAALALAEGGKPDDARKALVKLERYWKYDPKNVTYTDEAVAALAYDLLGPSGKARAAALMAGVWAGRQRLGALAAWPSVPQSPGPGQNAPGVGATAWICEAAEQTAPDDPRIDAVALWLMTNRSGDAWGAPSDTALTVMALTRYLGRSHEMQPSFDAQVRVNGRSVKFAHFGAESIDRPDVVLDIPGAALQDGKNTVRIVKTGQGRLYYSLDLREGLPAGPAETKPTFWQNVSTRLLHPDRLQPPFSPSGFQVKRVYLRTTSRRNFLWEDTVPAPDTDFRHDDTVLVRLIIDNTRPGSHLIVEEPVPAGCAITDVSGDETEDWENWWNYTDVRDDRIVFLIGDMPRGRHEIDYHLRAETAGTYDAMPTHITGTFDPTLHALGRVGRVTVE